MMEFFILIDWVTLLFIVLIISSKVLLYRIYEGGYIYLSVFYDTYYIYCFYIVNNNYKSEIV